MKRAITVVAGLVVGLSIAGLLAALVAVLAPDRWRGQSVIWAGTAGIVALSVWVAWRLAARSGK